MSEQTDLLQKLTQPWRIVSPDELGRVVTLLEQLIRDLGPYFGRTQVRSSTLGNLRRAVDAARLAMKAVEETENHNPS